ncbi:MAG: hypothetical protein AAF502_01135 [Bacteroidota bacterium]
MIKSFTKGISIGLKQSKIALTIYLLQLLLALPLALQVFRVLNASIGDSLEVEKLIYDYDNTIFRDFLNAHGDAITPLIGQTRWIVIVYFIFWIFLKGGVFYCIKEQTSRWETFWTGGARHFFRFLKVSVFFLVLHLVWAGLVMFIMSAILGDAINDMPTEREIVLAIAAGVIVWLVGLFFLIVANLLTKIKIVSEYRQKVWTSIVDGLKWTSANLFKGVGLYILFFLLQITFFGIYFGVDMASGMVSETLILVFFFLQQLLVFSRILIRIMAAGAFWDLHERSRPEPELIAHTTD